MTLKKLYILIEEAEKIAERLEKETRYTFYRALANDLQSMQQDIDTQWLIEDREKRETD